MKNTADKPSGNTMLYFGLAILAIVSFLLVLGSYLLTWSGLLGIRDDLANVRNKLISTDSSFSEFTAGEIGLSEADKTEILNMLMGSLPDAGTLKGEKGDTGDPGIAEIKVFYDSVDIPAGSRGSLGLNCPEGYKVLSGGCRTQGYPVPLLGSYPVTDGWYCEGYDNWPDPGSSLQGGIICYK